MNSSQKQEVKKLEDLFKRKLGDATFNTVNIREIVAIQKDDNAPSRVASPLGEFDDTRITNTKFDLAKAKKESEADLIVRMTNYLVSLISPTAKIHVDENCNDAKNFIPPDELRKSAYKEAKSQLKTEPTETDIQLAMDKILEKKPTPTIDGKKADNITRLSLHEFALYPHKDHGPLSIAGFTQLLNNVENIARRCPDNLHLIIATIPVMTTNNQVQNMAIYVECGAEPIIHTFTKSLPSWIDPVYEKTSNPNFSSAIPEQIFVTDLSDKKGEFARALEYKYEKLTEQMVQDFEDFCRRNPNIQPNANMLKELNNIKTKARDGTYKNAPDRKDQAYKDSEKLWIYINKFYYECEGKLDEASKHIRSTLWGSEDDLAKGRAINTHVSGNIISRTKGGTLFRTAADICLEHAYKIALETAKKSINDRRATSDSTILPNNVSHVVLSSTINIRLFNTISDTVTQADPYHSRDSSLTTKGVTDTKPPEDKIDLPTPDFGSHTVMHVYPSRPLSTHTHDVDEKITAHNRFMVKLQALYQYRVQRPEYNDVISAEIKKYIVDSFVSDLKKISSDPYIYASHRDLIDRYEKDFKNFAKDPVKRQEETEMVLDVMQLEASELKTDATELQVAIAKTHELLKQENKYAQEFQIQRKAFEKNQDKTSTTKTPPQAEKKSPASKASDTPQLHLFRKRVSTKTIIQTLVELFSTASFDVQNDINQIINSVLHRQVRKQLNNYMEALKSEKSPELAEIKQQVENAIKKLDTSKHDEINFRKHTLAELTSLKTKMQKTDAKGLEAPLDRWSTILKSTLDTTIKQDIDEIKTSDMVKLANHRNRTIADLFNTEHCLSALLELEDKAEKHESKETKQKRHHQIREAEIKYDNCIERLSDITKNINKLLKETKFVKTQPAKQNENESIRQEGHKKGMAPNKKS